MRKLEGFQRGINLGGWLSQCVAWTDGHFSGFIREEDIERIASFGLDHVRLPVDCDVVFADESGAVHERMHYVDDCISWCASHGLHVVLDLHKTYGYMFDEAVVKDPDAFFTDKGLQDTFIRLWTVLSRRYGKEKHVAFELLNEVTKPEYTEAWNAIAERAVCAIREIAEDTWILIGGVRHNSVRSVPTLRPPHDRKIVYNFHCYEPLAFTHQKAPWVPGLTQDRAYPEGNENAQAFEEWFMPAIRYAQEQDVPLYCGEYGVIDQAPAQDTARWYRDIHETFEKYGIGRAAWTYKQRDFGLMDAHYDGVREEIIRYL